jgi:DNA-binding NarL/FixJ family response regulator
MLIDKDGKDIMSVDTPSVLVVEDHEVFTAALLHMLQKENIAVKDVATTAEEALQKLPNLQVDLLLVDISLPHMSGLDLVAEVSRLYPGLPCMILSGHVASHYVRRALASGARGYVVKDNAEGVFEGIRRVLQGEIYIANGLGDIGN